jgi:hypothetical protein
MGAIDCTQVQYWVGAVGMVKSVEKEESVADHFAVKYKTETFSWTQKHILPDKATF